MPKKKEVEPLATVKFVEGELAHARKMISDEIALALHEYEPPWSVWFFLSVLAVCVMAAGLFTEGLLRERDAKVSALVRAGMQEISEMVRADARKNLDAQQAAVVSEGSLVPEVVALSPKREFSITFIPQVDKCWMQASADGISTQPSNGSGEPFSVTAHNEITLRDGCPGKIVFMRGNEVLHPAPEPGHRKNVEVVKFEKGEITQ